MRHKYEFSERGMMYNKHALFIYKVSNIYEWGNWNNGEHGGMLKLFEDDSLTQN